MPALLPDFLLWNWSGSRFQGSRFRVKENFRCHSGLSSCHEATWRCHFIHRAFETSWL